MRYFIGIGMDALKEQFDKNFKRTNTWVVDQSGIVWEIETTCYPFKFKRAPNERQIKGRQKRTKK